MLAAHLSQGRHEENELLSILATQTALANRAPRAVETDEEVMTAARAKSDAPGHGLTSL